MRAGLHQRRPFFSTCVGWPEELPILEHLISEREEISREDFLTRVDAQAMREAEAALGYIRRGAGLKMAEDYHVRYYLEPGSAVPFFVHSAVEHVFATPDDIAALREELCPPAFTHHDVLQWIEEIADDEDSENFDLHLLQCNMEVWDRDRLVVIVHPGDAFDEHGIFDALGRAMVEIRDEIRAGAGIVFVNRFSGTYMGPDGAFGPWTEWFDDCISLMDKAAHVYGDQLDQVADHILARTGADANILVTGLWSDEEHGCARMIHDQLAAAGRGSRLSAHSPDCGLRQEPDQAPGW